MKITVPDSYSNYIEEKKMGRPYSVPKDGVCWDTTGIFDRDMDRLPQPPKPRKDWLGYFRWLALRLPERIRDCFWRLIVWNVPKRIEVINEPFSQSESFTEDMTMWDELDKQLKWVKLP